MRKFFLTSIWALITSSIASHASTEKPQCGDGEYHWQGFQNECAAKRYWAADKALNAVYRSAMDKLAAEQKANLRQQQRKWLKTLESNCKESAGPRETSGNMWEMEYYDCLASTTAERTKELRNWRDIP